MDYVYKIMDYTEAEEDLRGIFGVSDTELPDSTIHRLSNLPAAERSIQQQVSSDLTLITDDDLLSVKLAVLYTAAANCLNAVRLNILSKESDTKTTAVRFKDALSLSAESLLSKAGYYLNAYNGVIATETTDQLAFISSDTDVITGLSND